MVRIFYRNALQKRSEVHLNVLAANLLGAMVGGVLEYLSLIIGHRNLVIVAAIAYIVAFLVWKRTLTLATALAQSSVG